VEEVIGVLMDGCYSPEGTDIFLYSDLDSDASGRCLCCTFEVYDTYCAFCRDGVHAQRSKLPE